MPVQTAFLLRCRNEILVSGYGKIHLSIPALDEGGQVLRSKDLLGPGNGRTEGKYTIEEHLSFLAGRELIPPHRPLLVMGMRNSLVNPRSIVVWGGEPFAVQGESPRESRRPYFGLSLKGGRPAMETRAAFPAKIQKSDYFCSGIPVFWDGDTPDQFDFGRLLVETADHSHLFDLPRGNHPAATDASRAAWQMLHETFLEHLHSDRETAERAMRKTLDQIDYPLRRSDDYLHSVLGVDDEGRLLNIIGHGRLEDLGRMAAARGCRRAICVENSGSVSPVFFKNGYQSETVPLLRSPNYRPQGRALLVIELDNESFGTLSS